LIVRGARQVGKTSFILNALAELKQYPQLKLNLLYPSSINLDGMEYFGRDFFGQAETGEEFIKNIELEIGAPKNLGYPVLVFIDEADRYPKSLEAIQTLATQSDKIKFIFTGSNLENIKVINAATGRKKYFDLFPIMFKEFLEAQTNSKFSTYLDQISLDHLEITEYLHHQLTEQLNTYLRLGGMPKILDTYLDPNLDTKQIPNIIKDLAVSIEENIKTVLDNKSMLYEYEDVLRKIANLSMNTLKFTQLQVQHAGRSEAKKLINKTVGARVAHKIRLLESEKDLSKYIIFDCGIANYLLSGSDLLKTKINEKNLAILYETFVGSQLITQLVTRDDLFYWKSGNRAEVEFLLRSPFIGIDVKSNKGNLKSLNSLAIVEENLSCIVKISNEMPKIDFDHMAFLPNFDKKRKIPLLTIPHYLTHKLIDITHEL
ncbi:MAG: hypothetical protein COS89_00625, partial [Deltaproteobacteria bacterium CG07_land_8_20_14_0_80_38_7]